MRRLAIGALVAAGVATVGLLVARPRPAAAERSPQGRVSAVTGSLLIRGEEDADWSYLEQNATVRDGDLLWCDENSTAEIELERGAWVRLGPDTRVDLRRLPPDGDLYLRRGSLYVDLSTATRAGALVRTAAGEVEVAAGGLTRIEVIQGDQVRVAVRRGECVADAFRGEERRVRAGEWALLTADDLRVSRIEPDALDAFDTWSDDRAEYYVENELPDGVDHYLPGVYELEDYGDWSEYRGQRVWRPRDVDDDWRPYNVGYWSYWEDEPCWVPQEQWGYVTHHYGRWDYADDDDCWQWYPDDDWGPGYVNWGRYNDYACWAPLNPWNRPCYRQPYHGAGFYADPLVWSFSIGARFGSGDPDFIFGLNVGSGIPVGAVYPVHHGYFYGGDNWWPHDRRWRGHHETDWSVAAAPARFRHLEGRPLRDEFGVGELRRPERRLRAGRDGRMERTLAWREEYGGRGGRPARGEVLADPVSIRRARDGRDGRLARREGGLLRGERLDRQRRGDRFRDGDRLARADTRARADRGDAVAGGQRQRADRNALAGGPDRGDRRDRALRAERRADARLRGDARQRADRPRAGGADRRLADGGRAGRSDRPNRAQRERDQERPRRAARDRGGVLRESDQRRAAAQRVDRQRRERANRDRANRQRTGQTRMARERVDRQRLNQGRRDRAEATRRASQARARRTERPQRSQRRVERPERFQRRERPQRSERSFSRERRGGGGGSSFRMPERRERPQRRERAEVRQSPPRRAERTGGGGASRRVERPQAGGGGGPRQDRAARREAGGARREGRGRR